MTSTLEDARLKEAAKTPVKKRAPVVRDRQDWVDATMAPDARKARDIVKAIVSEEQGGILVSLADIAMRIAAVTADEDVRTKLLERVEAFEQARILYQRQEGQPDHIVTWMGQDTTGNFYGEVPPGTPEHKVLMVVAWGALLRVVNEATKVGVQKKNRYSPIVLLVDIDAAPPATSQVWD